MQSQTDIRTENGNANKNNNSTRGKENEIPKINQTHHVSARSHTIDCSKSSDLSIFRPTETCDLPRQ